MFCHFLLFFLVFLIEGKEFGGHSQLRWYFSQKSVYVVFLHTFQTEKITFTQLLDIHFIGKKKIFKASPTHLLLPAFLANSFLVMPVNAKKSLVSTTFLSVETTREAVSVGYTEFGDPTLSPGGSGRC